MNGTLKLKDFAEAACLAAQLPPSVTVCVDDPYLFTALQDVIGSERVRLMLQLSDQKVLYSKRHYYIVREDSKVRWVRKDAVWGCEDARKIRSKLFVNEQQLKDYILYHINPCVTFCTKDVKLFQEIGTWRHDVWVTADTCNLLAIKIVIGKPLAGTINYIDRYTLYLYDRNRKIDCV